MCLAAGFNGTAAEHLRLLSYLRRNYGSGHALTWRDFDPRG